MLDLNEAPEQRGELKLIPDGTICVVQMKLRHGGAGEGGILKRSKNGESEALDAELIVVDGPYAKHKFWTLLTMRGTGPGHAQAGEISLSILRAILESARGVRPDDTSDAAKARRRAEFADFDGLRFMVKVGIEAGGIKPGNAGSYADKNRIAEVITPERVGWHPVEQPPRAAGAPPVTPTAPATMPVRFDKPDWANNDPPRAA